MELDIIARRSFIVHLINDFLSKNDLIFFEDINYHKEGLKFGELLSENDYLNKDMAIEIGTKENFDKKIRSLNTRPYIEDKDDFIYILNSHDKDDLKVSETSFIWQPSKSESVKQIGKLLKKHISSHCNIGMEVVDAQDVGYNKRLQKFYWPEEVLSYSEKLFYPIAVQVVPIIKDSQK
ncbi:hypothetical protein [Lysinibacillus sp. TE18511]